MEQLRIVVAEDRLSPSAPLYEQLARLGHKVIAHASDGRDVIRLVRETRPDLVVLDTRMMGMDGLGVAREINKLSPTPIIMVSSHTNSQLIEEASKAGAGAYLTRPVNDKELERGITVALTRFREIEVERRAREGYVRLAEEQRILLETSRSVLASLDLGQVFDTLTEKLSWAVKVPFCIVLTLNELRTELEVRSAYPGNGDGPSSLVGRRVRMETAPFAYASVMRKEVVTTENMVYSEVPIELRDVVMKLRITSALFVPVVLREQTIGLVMLADSRSREFTEGERVLCQTIVNQAAVAIENARLFQRVEQAKQEWEGTFDAISDCISIHDFNCHMLRVNVALSRRLGHSPAEMIGRLCYRSLNGKESCQDDCPHLVSLKTGLPASAEVEVPVLGGVFEVSTYPIYDFGQGIQAIVHSARDVTEVKKAQERIREEAEVSSALLQVSEIVSYSTSIDELLEAVCRVTVGLVNVDYCATWLWDKRIQSFLAGQVVAKDGSVAFRTPPLKPEDLLLTDGQLRSVTPIFLNETIYPRIVPVQHVRSFNIKTIVVVPLVSKGQMMGAMTIMHTVTDYRFGPKEMSIITGIVNQVAVAVENMALRQHDISAFYELSQFPDTRLSMEQLSARILDRVASVSSCDAGYLWIRDTRNGAFETKARWGDTAHLLPNSSWMTDEFVIRHVPRAAPSPAILKDGTDLWKTICRNGNARLVLVVAMRVERDLIGALAFAFSEKESPSKERLMLLSTLAGQAGLVIRNAQLYLAAQELSISEERGRIAREMHDGVAQNLAHLMMKTELITRLINMDSERARSEVIRMRAVLEDSVHELRRCIYALRPVSLESGGLFIALRKLVKDFSDQNDVDIELLLPNITVEFSAKLEGAVFRIVQEALNNVRKHCQANHVSVKIGFDNGDLQLEIEDDGMGFLYDEESSTRQGHLGLAQMRERAEDLGGTLSIKSFPQLGTKIHALLPVEQRN